MFLQVQRKLNKLIVGKNRDEFDLHVKHLASNAARLLGTKNKGQRDERTCVPGVQGPAGSTQGVGGGCG